MCEEVRTVADGMDGLSLRSMWENAVSAHSDKEYLVFCSADGTESRYTYERFDCLANQTANFFWKLGVRKGQTVAVHLCSSVDFMLCLFGLAKIGGVMVPVNEQNLKAESAYILGRCMPAAVVCEPRFLELYEQIRAEDPRLVKELVVARSNEGRSGAVNFAEGVLRQSERLQASVELSSFDTVEVMFTSGTTSRPKGVEFTHANFVYAGWYAQWQTALRSDDVLFTTMPACHSNFQLAAMMPVIAAGASLVLVEKYSASRFWDQVRRFEGTIIQCVSMMVRTLLLQPERANDRDNDVREVLYFLPLDTESKERFEERFNVRIMNSYGSTESLNWVITDYPTGPRKWPSVGRAGLGYEARIVDENGCELPRGEVGDIEVKGVPGRTIMKGYFNDPKATAATIGAEGWMSTGDKGWCDDEGFFYFVDRVANMIKRSGENISAAEVEEVLESCELIAEAAVVGEDDPIRDQLVKAFVVPTAGARITVEDVLAYCRANLAAFKVPSIVEIRSELPHTCSMKVEKKLLRAQVASAPGVSVAGALSDAQAAQPASAAWPADRSAASAAEGSPVAPDFDAGEGGNAL